MEKHYFYNNYLAEKIGYKLTQKDTRYESIRAKFHLYVGCLSLVIAYVVILPLRIVNFHTIANQLLRLVSKIVLWVVDLRITRNGNLSSDRPLFMIANHYSWLDTVIIVSLIPGSVVYKAKLTSHTIISSIIKVLNGVCIDRENRTQVKAQCRAIHNQLSKNQNIIIYPEGATGKGGITGKFISTLFASTAMCVNNRKINIQPIALVYKSMRHINCNRFMRNHLSWDSSRSLKAHLHMLAKHRSTQAVVQILPTCQLSDYHNRHNLSRSLQYQIQTAINQSLT